jgi:hypothetical protein
MLEQLRRWWKKPRGVEETEPPKPDLTPEEQAARDEEDSTPDPTGDRSE